MPDAIRPLIAGNWKMNGLKSSSVEFEAMLAGAPDVAVKADLLVCPPATLIAAFADKARGSRTLKVGAQDCHPKPSGAHTGEPGRSRMAISLTVVIVIAFFCANAVTARSSTTATFAIVVILALD